MEEIAVAITKKDNNNFIWVYFRKDAFKQFIDDVNKGRFAILDLPEPFHNVKVIWRNEGYLQLTVKIRNMTKSSLRTEEMEHRIMGSAMLLMCENGEYKGLTAEIHKKLLESKAVEFEF
ncbi:hypothetical protein ACFYU8_17725 [Brevibacillus sp. NPDC003359]|uniref:hypothetical protein n=1 Tax=unclassified Brevibacillus TaxID=2684853 RepID=UPI0036C8349D